MSQSMQTPCHPNLWSPYNTNMVPDMSSTRMVEVHGNHMMPTPFSAYGLGRNGTHLDDYVGSSPCGTLQPAPYYPEKQPLLYLVGQGTHDSGAYLHGDSNAYLPLAHSPFEVPFYYPTSSNQDTPGPFIPHYVPRSPSFSPSSPLWVTHQASRSYSPIFLPQCPDPNGTARRRRPARAVEYEGLWIDDEELSQGLLEPDGTLHVHQCRWEEDQSPCHLWVKGDKSCINVHIQKWHGGKAGGDEHKIACRWSGCGMTMWKESIARHIVNIHLGEIWKCQGCGKGIARGDAYRRHAAKYKACQASGVVITYDGAKVVDARAALASGGNVRYAGV